MSLDELRRRMPELRAREQSVRAERQAILDQAADQMSFLRLAETLTAFLQRLRQSADTLEIAERQKVVRLLVKEVLVDNDTITIRHSIPAQAPTSPVGGAPLPSNANSGSAMKVTFCVRGVISPLLSNLYLNEVDRMLERAREITRNGKYTYIEYARFADDLVILIGQEIPKDGGKVRVLSIPGWEWLVGAPRQFVPQLLEQSLRALRLNDLEGHRVYSRSPIVLFGHLIRCA
jgi:hypothetical protein